MPLQATSGAASYDAFGGGVPVVPNYIEDVFSTWLYTGTGSTQTITNGIDLSTKGGLVWLKSRSLSGEFHRLFDTSRGVNNLLASNATFAQQTGPSTLTAFNTTGFNLGSDPDGYGTNTSAATYASWTFRKQPKFFDVVTFTATRSGSGWSGGPVVVNHSLGSTPGCVMWKAVDNTSNWYVNHRSLGNQYRSFLNTTDASVDTGIANYINPTSTNVTFSNATCGIVGDGVTVTIVVYLFAHNAGGFGLTGTDNVISCGSFTYVSGTLSVNLGYEPQWVMIKQADGAGSWFINDNMRNWRADNSTAGTGTLYAQSSNAEGTGGADWNITSTGFNVTSGTGTFIYIAIRRGPMKVPTSGTSVFYPLARTGTAANATITGFGFPPDMAIGQWRGGGNTIYLADRLRGISAYLPTNSTGVENTNYTNSITAFGQDGINVGPDGNIGDFNYTVSLINWNFRRAPSFFDEVCFTSDSGGGTGANLPHNLTVQPNLMIFKARGSTSDWIVTCTEFASWQYFKMYLNSTTAKTLDGSGVANSSASTFSVFNNGQLPANSTCVAYLFATCAGVSKVGSYTGTGALQTVNCGFTSGARFVLIKRTDSTGDWWTYDSARGITSGNDPYLFLNSTAAEVTSTNYVDTDSTGFKVTAAAPAGLNDSGGTYIFLAIA